MVDINSLISVQVSLAAAAAQGQNRTNLLVLTNSNVIDLSERFRVYTSPTEVAMDFGEGGTEFAAAELHFAQVPQPPQLLIGRWAQSAAAGVLSCAPLTATQQAIANFNTIADGGFGISINGAGVEQIAGINLTAAMNLNAVAAAITTALAGAATCVWIAAYGYFEFTSNETGAPSAVSFLTAATGGGVTDLSSLLGGRSTSSGAYVVPGQAAETALAAAVLFDAEFGGQWYALSMPTIVTDSDHVAVGTFIQSASTYKHFYGVSTGEAGVLVPGSTTDVGYLLAAANLTKTAWMYSSTSAVCIVSLLARILTVDYTAANSTINLMWQNCPGLAPENLSATALASIQAKNGNVFSQTSSGTTAINGTPILLTGVTATSNVWIDQIIGADNYALDLQLACFNALKAAALTPGKVPQTDAGMHLLTTACETVNAQYLANGFLGPNTWPYAGFGSLQTGQYMETGAYTYAAPIATQSQVSRAARTGVPIQIAATLADAVNTAAVLVSLVP